MHVVVRHAPVEVNVVIGVHVIEHVVLLVVRVVPIFVCDAVVHLTLVLTALYRSHCFHLAISVANFLCWRYSVYTHRR